MGLGRRIRVGVPIVVANSTVVLAVTRACDLEMLWRASVD